MTRLKNEQLNFELISKQEQFNNFSSEIVSTDSIVYFKLFRRLFKFLCDDFIKNRRKSIFFTLFFNALDDVNFF